MKALFTPTIRANIWPIRARVRWVDGPEEVRPEDVEAFNRLFQATGLCATVPPPEVWYSYPRLVVEDFAPLYNGPKDWGRPLNPLRGLARLGRQVLRGKEEAVRRTVIDLALRVGLLDPLGRVGAGWDRLSISMYLWRGKLIFPLLSGDTLSAWMTAGVVILLLKEVVEEGAEGEKDLSRWCMDRLGLLGEEREALAQVRSWAEKALETGRDYPPPPNLPDYVWALSSAMGTVMYMLDSMRRHGTAQGLLELGIKGLLVPPTGFPSLPEEGAPSDVLAYAGAFSLALLELAALTGGRAPQHCEYCGRTFYPARAGQRFCSKSCRNMASRQRARVSAKGP